MRRSRSALLGGALLLIAVIAALVVPRLLDPPTVDGAAVVAPAPRHRPSVTAGGTRSPPTPTTRPTG